MQPLSLGNQTNNGRMTLMGDAACSRSIAAYRTGCTDCTCTFPLEFLAKADCGLFLASLAAPHPPPPPRSSRDLILAPEAAGSCLL